jgi:hypothetical protein
MRPPLGSGCSRLPGHSLTPVTADCNVTHAVGVKVDHLACALSSLPDFRMPVLRLLLRLSRDRTTYMDAIARCYARATNHRVRLLCGCPAVLKRAPDTLFVTVRSNVWSRYRDLPRRSAIRVCQPGPVAFQRSITSAGNRNVRSFRGLAATGRPRFFTTMRPSISSVSSGPSSYS